MEQLEALLAKLESKIAHRKSGMFVKAPVYSTTQCQITSKEPVSQTVGNPMTEKKEKKTLRRSSTLWTAA